MSAVENDSASSGVLAETLSFRMPKFPQIQDLHSFHISHWEIPNILLHTYYFVVYPGHDKTLEGAACVLNSGWGDGGSGTNAEYLCILKHV